MESELIDDETISRLMLAINHKDTFIRMANSGFTAKETIQIIKQENKTNENGSIR